MAGDTISLNTYGWYQGAVQPPPAGEPCLLQDFLSALTGDVISGSGGKYGSGQNSLITSAISPSVTDFLTDDNTDNYNTAAPKAYLSWAAFDNQFNFVGDNSGAVQMPVITGSMQKQALIGAQKMVMEKSGYIYIYVSNESAQDVYFDNLSIRHISGPIEEEDHYYPFGLSMAGISDQAALKPENRLKFNGKEIQHREFSDGSGLQWYDFGSRAFDQQIGVWQSLDPLSENFYGQSPYVGMDDNPVDKNDPTGGAASGTADPAPQVQQPEDRTEEQSSYEVKDYQDGSDPNGIGPESNFYDSKGNTVKHYLRDTMKVNYD